MDEMLNERTITIRKYKAAGGLDWYYIEINGAKGPDGPVLGYIRYEPDKVFKAISTLTVRYGPCKIVYETKNQSQTHERK